MVVVALAMPVWAQRAVPRGGPQNGFAGHGVSAPRSFSPSSGFASHGPINMRPAPGPRGFNYGAAPVRFGPTSRPIGNRPIANRPAARMPYTRFGPDHSHGPAHGPGDGDHHHHRGVYWGGYVYPYYPWYYTGPIFTGFVDPWLFGPDTYDYNNGYGSSAYGADVAAPYRDYGAQSSQPYPQEYYEGDPATAAQSFGRGQSYTAQPDVSGTVAGPARENTVTVIFNDGRPPAHIHNYLLTANTLTVLDPQYREIPLAQVNIVATQQTNRAAGIDFNLPARR
jgi:hypothetical protein